ncbi:hypothetical protein O9929_17580 [Vibrio lentus]|nr:hypothetical protein [Vibrio lentus]
MANHCSVPIIEDDVYLELSYSHPHTIACKCYDKGGYVLWGVGPVSEKPVARSYRLRLVLAGRYLDEYKAQFSAAGYGVAPTHSAFAVADCSLANTRTNTLKKMLWISTVAPATTLVI